VPAPLFAAPRTNLRKLSWDTSSRLLSGDDTQEITLPVPTSMDRSESGDGEKEEEGPMVLKAALTYVGPYPCASLRFPNLATPSQQERNATGISLDFVLDTGANLNTINSQVASELELLKVGSAPAGIGAGGAISGGDTFLLGDCQLEQQIIISPEPPSDDSKKDSSDEKEIIPPTPIFMTDLTASALPVASPAAAGLLGTYFFQCFPGGVEFDWNGDQATGVPPSISFYGEESDVTDIERVEIKLLPVTNLPSIDIIINGVTVPALLDTGSPVTVLNAKAAQLTKVETVMDEQKKKQTNPFNPFAKLTQGFQTAQMASTGDVLLLAGALGERIELYKSSGGGIPIAVSPSCSFGDDCTVYVGDLPGMAALGGSDSSPAVILGMDVLRRRPKMLYRAPNAVYF